MKQVGLKYIRLYHRYSQTDLAKELNISKSYLSEIESNKKEVSIKLLKQYSKVLIYLFLLFSFFQKN